MFDSLILWSKNRILSPPHHISGLLSVLPDLPHLLHDLRGHPARRPHKRLADLIPCDVTACGQEGTDAKVYTHARTRTHTHAHTHTHTEREDTIQRKQNETCRTIVWMDLDEYLRSSYVNGLGRSVHHKAAVTQKVGLIPAGICRELRFALWRASAKGWEGEAIF